MKWAEHLADKDTFILRAVSVGPMSRSAQQNLRNEATKLQEKQLSRLGGNFERVMPRCIERIKIVPHETLRWLANADPIKPSARPFEATLQADTLVRYQI